MAVGDGFHAVAPSRARRSIRVNFNDTDSDVNGRGDSKDEEDAGDEEDANDTAQPASQPIARSQPQPQPLARQPIGWPHGQHHPLHFEHNRRGGWKGTEHWNYAQVPSHDIRCDNCDRFLTEVIALCPRRYRARDSGAAVLQRCQGCHFSTCRLCFDARNFDPDVHPLCRVSLDWGISRRIMTYMLPKSTPDPAPVVYSEDEEAMPPPLGMAKTAATGRKRTAASGRSSGRISQGVTAQTSTQNDSTARSAAAPRQSATEVPFDRRAPNVPVIVVASRK